MSHICQNVKTMLDAWVCMIRVFIQLFGGSTDADVFVLIKFKMLRFAEARRREIFQTCRANSAGVKCIVRRQRRNGAVGTVVGARLATLLWNGAAGACASSKLANRRARPAPWRWHRGGSLAPSVSPCRRYRVHFVEAYGPG
ncbi:uncharacterized protein LOC112460195 [Temnothorax curvispinosus]|uniref:Uncharacterized protein LOC112460195 n=1 Tax=Temnothorax curvispinosus TaxID=300111 RepID=A0A6J1QE02_9HYME|nr:uncharacterized protein LOC112460195 [Temnothorax curvispinosus]